MSVDSLIFWAFVAAWLGVAGVFLFVIVPAIVLEIRKILEHVTRLVDRSAVPLMIAKAEGDLTRIESAGVRLEAVNARAQAAVDVIRTTPLVPPQISQFVARVRVEIAAFQQAQR